VLRIEWDGFERRAVLDCRESDWEWQYGWYFHLPRRKLMIICVNRENRILEEIVFVFVIATTDNNKNKDM
jgi:hypothetical protein